MRRLAGRLVLVVLALIWLAGQSLPRGLVTPVLADASACASPGFVLQRAPLTDGVHDAHAAAPQRFVDGPVQPQSLPVADYSVSVVDSPDPILPGNSLTYTITVLNNGPDDGDGLLTGVVPAGTTFVSMVAAGNSGCWVCTTPPVGGTGAFSCDSAVFPATTSEEFVLVVLVTSAAPLGSQIEHTVSLTGLVTDPTSSNNSATAFTTVPAATATTTPTPTTTPIPTTTGTPTHTPTATVTPTGTLPPTSTPTLVPATVTPTVPSTRVTSDDKPKPKSDTQRQQDDHTNQLGRDDYHTEGNVTEVVLDAVPPYAVIATRDGLVQVLLACEDGCPTVRVGDYLQADGVKENEGLFTAEDVTISR